MKRLVFCILAVLSVLYGAPAQAQRLIPGQWQFSLGGGGWYHIPVEDVANPTLYGAELSFDRIDYGSKMVIRVNGLASRNGDYYVARNEDAGWDAAAVPLKYFDLYASFGYLWNVAHNRSRGVNLWAGGTVDAGARIRRLVDRSVPAYGYPGVSFLPGVSPELNLEFFLGRSTSVSLFFRAHMQWPAVLKVYSGNSAEPWFLPLAGLALNFNFFVDR